MCAKNIQIVKKQNSNKGTIDIVEEEKGQKVGKTKNIKYYHD